MRSILLASMVLALVSCSDTTTAPDSYPTATVNAIDIGTTENHGKIIGYGVCIEDPANTSGNEWQFHYVLRADGTITEYRAVRNAMGMFELDGSSRTVGSIND